MSKKSGFSDEFNFREWSKIFLINCRTFYATILIYDGVGIIQMSESKQKEFFFFIFTQIQEHHLFF